MIVAPYEIKRASSRETFRFHPEITSGFRVTLVTTIRFELMPSRCQSSTVDAPDPDEILRWISGALMDRQELLRLAKQARLAQRAARKLKRLQEKFPLHECVDRPDLPCPACLRATANPFATVQKEPSREKKKK